MIMKKHTYMQPEMAVKEVHLDAFVMLLNSNSGIEPSGAPARVAPPVPGADLPTKRVL